MRMQFFGDSYDIVKRFLIQSLAPDAEWVAFPMFSHPVTHQQVEAFEKFLGVHVVSETIITRSTNRVEHLTALSHHRHILIDPDTGIRLEGPKGADQAEYVFGPELVGLCNENPERLLLVFDQSVQRGRESESIGVKLGYFRENSIFGFAYWSHACFVILSASNPICQKAYDRLLGSGLPASRLLTGENAQQSAPADGRPESPTSPKSRERL
jgi:hypothetical protein